ncbi:Fic family protein [Rhodoglobus vestalii]|uniref:Fic family protein n=2 Tax=Rhodoglobus vestalii TaxID=193384 RepID=A0A8H2K885_9MICO|nr:Fic family protein [Rhodoglobus vestalii]
MMREPAGRPGGGQFSARRNSEAEVVLDESWPALGYESQTWTGIPQAFLGPEAEMWMARPQEYNSAVPPHIASLTPGLDPETVQKSNAATIELSRFDAGLGDRMANFGPVLLRSEAASSSQIENLTASARQILTAELGATTNRNAMLIAANTTALRAAIALADEPTGESMLHMHAALMEHQPQHTPGQWRTEPVWIGTNARTPIGATFIAPHEDRIPALIADLAEFGARHDVPALTQVAIAHAQFETIHPFSDGNGRTGRAYAQALLRKRGVTRNVAVPVSAGLLAHVGEYHDALTAYRDGDPNPIVNQFADASFVAIANSRRMLDEIDMVTADWRTAIKVRSDSKVWALLDVIQRRPVINATTAAAELGIQQPNVYPLLHTLTEQGILKSKNEHHAGQFWRSDEILKTLDTFAERAGRRTWS